MHNFCPHHTLVCGMWVSLVSRHGMRLPANLVEGESTICNPSEPVHSLSADRTLAVPLHRCHMATGCLVISQAKMQGIKE